MSEQTTYPRLVDGFRAVLVRDLLLAWKRPGDILNPLFFFAMVCTLFPLALGPDVDQLRAIGPGVTWVAALLAMLLALNSLFLGDYEDGSLEQLLLSPQPLPMLALAKTAAHWLLTGLPLLLVAPLIGVSYQLESDVIRIMVLTLLPGLDRRSIDRRHQSGKRAVEPFGAAIGNAGAYFRCAHRVPRTNR